MAENAAAVAPVSLSPTRRKRARTASEGIRTTASAEGVKFRYPRDGVGPVAVRRSGDAWKAHVCATFRCVFRDAPDGQAPVYRFGEPDDAQL